MRFKLIVLILVAFTYLSANAQDISFTATAPKTVKVGEQFRITYKINEKVSDFKPPQFNNFVILGSQQGISTVNWKTTRQYIYVFKATQKGKFTVGPATATFKRETIESNELEIEVVDGGQASQANQSSADASQATVTSSGNEDIFVRLIFDKKNVTVGEQLTGYIKVYTKPNLRGVDYNFQGPDLSGFYVQNIKVPQIRSLEPEKVGEETYYSGLIRKVLLTPQRSGKITIKPFEVIVYRDEKVRIGSFTTYQTQDVPLKTKAVTVNVKALPANRPKGFAGAVGNYTIKASLSSNNIKTNDAVVFKVKVSGTGNVKLIDDINYNLPPALDVFDPVTKTSIAENGLSGSKTFEITAIPRHAGKFTIKPFEFVFYNPKTKSFITKKTPSFILNVKKSEGDSSTVVISNLSREDVELLQSDIRYIKTNTHFKFRDSYIVDSFIYYMAFIILLLLFAGVLLMRKEQVKRNSNIAKTRNRKASKMANKRLKLAKKLLNSNNDKAFYEELSKALWGYISDKLIISRSELSASQAAQILKDKNLDSNMVDELMEIIADCEYARYAPGAVDKPASELLVNANVLLSRIDQKI